MNIKINKTVKVGDYNGSLRISIPNMVHTMTEIEVGDALLFREIEYDENSNEMVFRLEKIKGN